MEYTCKICGQTENSDNWTNGHEMQERQLCFTCNFWMQNHEEDLRVGKYEYAIIEGTHYRLLPHTNDFFKGFGGAKTRITFFDGHVEECDNLWCLGDIPERFRDIMPDNATIEWL